MKPSTIIKLDLSEEVDKLVKYINHEAKIYDITRRELLKYSIIELRKQLDK